MEFNPPVSSSPLTGMLVGLILGTMLGIAAVVYFGVEPLLDQFCLVGIAVMTGQLFGAIVGATLAKPKS